MNQLLANVLDAHGGLNRWNNYQKVEASIVTGGGFCALEGMLQDSTPRRMSVWLHEERSSVLPFGAPDQRTMFTPERIAIEKLDGTVVAERHAPKDSFAGHQDEHSLGPTPEGVLQRRSCMDISHHTTPSCDGWVRVVETAPWQDRAETWRILRAYFPRSIETHSLIQDFFFGESDFISWISLREEDFCAISFSGWALESKTCVQLNRSVKSCWLVGSVPPF
jgi:hypothetical protein